MYQIGDKIFYPMHGAGTIEAIEEKEILGEKHLYFVMRIPLRNLMVMIPMDKIEALGIRDVVNSNIIEDTFANFQQEEADPAVSPIQRNRNNIIKMKSGDFHKEAQVIRDLTRLSKKKTLGAADKFMLNDARKIIISELVLAKGIEQDQAADILNKAIK